MKGAIASTSPIGSFLTIATFLLLVASKLPPSTISPTDLSPSSAEYLIRSAVLTTSLIAAFIPFETSFASTVPIISLSLSKISAALYRYFALSTTAKFLHPLRAILAVSIA